VKVVRGNTKRLGENFYPSSALRAPSPTRGEGENQLIHPTGTPYRVRGRLFSHKGRKRKSAIPRFKQEWLAAS